ncbi:duffy binding-like domain-containing protein, partial [Streptococcus australis]|nr:duffy binding-like domain-containing protein [Streptococcus australis]
MRDAFIQSAAVETFFLWHRYKKEKEIEKKQQQENGELVPFVSAAPQVGMTAITSGAGAPKIPSPQLTSKNSDDPQSKLQQTGEIPNDFLRLMFYTLGDYRDILFSGSNNNNIVLEASGNTEEGRKEMQKIQQKIKDIVEKPNGVPPPSDKNPKTLWQTFGPSIWEGIVCALTYNTDTAIGTPPKQIDEVRDNLLK